MSAGKSLWEILVPTHWPDETFIPIATHHAWDELVRGYSEGMTILRSALGEWKDGDKILRERMIPVRFLGSSEQALHVALFSKRFYKQDKIMYYKLSDEVHLV